MPAPIPRQDVQMALRIMASQAREAREAWRRELAACQEKSLIKHNPYRVPASLTERFAHWSAANLMLHTAVTHLLFSGRNTRRVDRYVADLIAGEHWPTETGPGPVTEAGAHAAGCGLQGSGLDKRCTCEATDHLAEEARQAGYASLAEARDFGWKPRSSDSGL